MNLNNFFLTRRKRDLIGGLSYYETTVHSISVRWLQIDSYRNWEVAKVISTAYSIEIDGPVEEPSSSSPTFIIIDSEKDDLEVLVNDENWKIGDIVGSGRTMNEEKSYSIESLKYSCVDSELPVPKAVF